MSLPTLSELARVLPTNCASQPGSRTSPPVGLAVLQDFDAHHASAGVERHRVVDIEALADDVIDYEEAEELCGAGRRLFSFAWRFT